MTNGSSISRTLSSETPPAKQLSAPHPEAALSPLVVASKEPRLQGALPSATASVELGRLANDNRQSKASLIPSFQTRLARFPINKRRKEPRKGVSMETHPHNSATEREAGTVAFASALGSCTGRSRRRTEGKGPGLGAGPGQQRGHRRALQRA